MSTDIFVVKVKGRFKCRTFHWPNLMEISKNNYNFLSFTLGWAHVKVRRLNQALVIPQTAFDTFL